MDANDDAAVLAKGLWMATRGWEIFIEHDESGACTVLATRAEERASMRVPARHSA